MKNLKKVLAVLIAAVMVFAMGITVFGQTESAGEGPGSITINNAAKGETYSVFKLFDATVSEDGEHINYTGDIPESLAAYFTKDSAGNISVAADVEDAAVAAAVQAWGAAQTSGAAASAVSDGSALTFDGLDYGYYAITSSQGAVVSVDSTQPDASIYDKNTSTVDIEKTVDKESYSIGDTVTYTATFDTVTWLGEGADAKQVVNYVVSDTLPEFLSNVNVTSITVDDEAIALQQFDANKSITIPWATKGDDGSYTSIYKNGAVLKITYTAVLTSTTNINTNDTNTVTIQPYVDNGSDNPEPWNRSWEDTAEIKTYAAALKKTDGTNPLDGAQFTIKGLTVTGEDGVYTVVSYDPNGEESAALDTNDDGKLYIIGLASDVTLVVTEYKAPDGYNKLDGTVDVTPQLLSTKIYKESGTIYYDADGNVVAEESNSESSETVNANLTDLDEAAVEVVNNAGATLPSTGGIGTTIFYIIGGCVVLAAVIFLIVRSKKSSAK